MSNQPTQQEVDCIAAYVEAATELQKEPFFHRDEKRGLQFGGEGNFSFYFGDRFHFRSALVTFRRIWMNDESSNFNHCCNILWRYLPNPQNPLLQSWRETVKQTVSAKAFQPPIPVKDENLTVTQLIDLWLNAVFAHVSIEKEMDTRHKFDGYLKKYGQAFLEYPFRTAVFQLGLAYMNMARHNATPFLRYWEEQGTLMPSFTIGAPFGDKMHEVTPEGHVVVRKGSSRFYNEETVEQLFERVISRHEHSSIKSVLDQTGVALSKKTRLFLTCNSIEEVVERAGLRLNIQESLSPDPRSFSSSPKFRGFTSLFDMRTHTKSYLIREEHDLATDKVGIEILNRGLQLFKTQFLEAAQE
jgi:hypothetical protein